MGNIKPKESDLLNENIEINKVQKLDLHGFSLIEANKMVEDFIVKSFNNGYKKLLIVTGKGSRSKSHKNPYLSEKLSVLKYSVPEYIKNDENLTSKIIKISEADIKHGGEGAINIFLKNNNKFTK
ncbi:MAG: DNA mismatch repair protein MutS [Candidatus Pelagibacterales bacterium]|nr:MAG: DNA mismatch repair protein MutS [Pelagibacterales bacterium]